MKWPWQNTGATPQTDYHGSWPTQGDEEAAKDDQRRQSEQRAQDRGDGAYKPWEQE
jgi:hypothetical protein